MNLIINEAVKKHIDEHRKMLEAQGLLYDFIKEEKESFDAYDPEFYQILNVGDVISINLAKDPVFTEDNTFSIMNIEDKHVLTGQGFVVNKILTLVSIGDLHQTWMSMYMKSLDEFQLQGIAENKLKLYKIKKPCSLKFIFTD